MRPLEKDVADIEGLKDPHPIVVTEMKVFHNSGGLRVANVSTVEIGQHVKKAHDGKHLLVELECGVSAYTEVRRDVRYFSSNTCLSVCWYVNSRHLCFRLGRLDEFDGSNLLLALFNIRHYVDGQ